MSTRHALIVDEATSKRMAGIRQRGTKPEWIVRKLLHGLGVRYRIDNGDLPGSPDIANRRKRFAIFVHGCFWHRHPNCKKTTTPKRNREFWLSKFAANVHRDARVMAELKELGFDVFVIWECETNDISLIRERLSCIIPREFHERDR